MDLALSLAVCLVALLAVMVPALHSLYEARRNGRLLRRGGRAVAVVTRLDDRGEYRWVEVEYTPPGRRRPVRRWLTWENGHPVPAVGDAVPVRHLPGRWGRADFEANIRWAPSL